MNQCSSFHIQEKTIYIPNEIPHYQIETYGLCWGTKECDRCSCGGDTSKCDFYPEKRGEAKMNTAEMWLKAQEDGKTYKRTNGQMRYNRHKGFHGPNYSRWEADVFSWVDEIFDIEWMVAPDYEMTKEEAEKKFGIKIID